MPHLLNVTNFFERCQIPPLPLYERGLGGFEGIMIYCLSKVKANYPIV